VSLWMQKHPTTRTMLAWFGASRPSLAACQKYVAWLIGTSSSDVLFCGPHVSMCESKWTTLTGPYTAAAARSRGSVMV
jgi:hypothetical protein